MCWALATNDGCTMMQTDVTAQGARSGSQGTAGVFSSRKGLDPGDIQGRSSVQNKWAGGFSRRFQNWENAGRMV